VHVLRFDAVPVLSAYALLAGVVAYAVRHPEAGRPEAGRPVAGRPVAGRPVAGSRGWPVRIRLIAVTVGGGYACFLVIVLVFHVWVVGDGAALGSAIRGGGFLAVVCAAAFGLGSFMESTRR
jgi:hypothetical protein